MALLPKPYPFKLQKDYASSLLRDKDLSSGPDSLVQVRGADPDGLAADSEPRQAPECLAAGTRADVLADSECSEPLQTRTRQAHFIPVPPRRRSFGLRLHQELKRQPLSIRFGYTISSKFHRLAWTCRRNSR